MFQDSWKLTEKSHEIHPKTPLKLLKFFQLLLIFNTRIFILNLFLEFILSITEQNLKKTIRF